MHRIAPLGQTKSSILTELLLKNTGLDKRYFENKLEKQLQQQIKQRLNREITDIFNKIDEAQLGIIEAKNDLDINIISTQIGKLNKKLTELQQQLRNLNQKK